MSYIEETLETKYSMSAGIIEHNLSTCMLSIKVQHAPDLYMGAESWASTVHNIKYQATFLRVAAKELANILAPLGMLVARKAEVALRSYDKLNEAYRRRIAMRMDELDANKFEKTVINTVPKEILMRRIEVAKAIYDFMEEVNSVCAAPIDVKNASVWDESKLKDIQTQLATIGISIGKFSLVPKPPMEFTDYNKKLTIKQLGYSLDELDDIMVAADKLSKYCQKDYVNKVTETIATYFDKLAKAEIAINKADESDEKKDELQSTEVRTVRLWSISIIFKVLPMLADAIFKTIMTVDIAAMGSKTKRRPDSDN